MRIAAVVALAAGVVALLLSPQFLGGGVEDRIGQFVLFHLRGALPPPPEVLVVAEDRSSAEALGLPPGTRRWPRHLHARAIDKLAASGAAVIAFDLIFSTPDPQSDDLLARAIRHAGNVVLLQGLERRMIYGQGGASVEIDQPIDPIPQLAEAAAAVARFPLPKVPARVDRYWTFHGLLGLPTVPSVAVQLAARDLAPRWTELLAAEPGLPKFAVEDWSGARLIAAMQELHAALRADPDAADRLRARLQRIAGSEDEKRRLSALVELYAAEDSRYLNLRGPAGTIRTVSYAALFAKPPGDLSGKVVFIGVSELHSATQPDSYDTVFSGANGINVNGAEIAATAVADLAEGASPRRPGPAAIIELTLIALVLGIAASTGRIALVLGAGAAIAAATLAGGWYMFQTQYWLLPVAAPTLFQIPAGVLTAMWCYRAEERRQRQRMAGAARQYLPEEVVRSLASGPLRGPADLAGEIRFSVCLASDIEGFTTLSERLPPNTVQQLLNQYFHGMFEVMQRHGGVISDIAGDGVMCVWTAPAHSPQACAGAVGAAVELLDAVEQFNLGHPDQRLPTRIGIHAGSALVGIVGGAGRYASTIVGDVANTASRVEGLNKQLGTRLLASEEVLRGVAGFVLRPLGDFLLAGKSEPIRVAEVLGHTGDPNATALAGDFAEAFECFQQRRWSEAAQRFEALLRAHPGDGPSRYFLSRIWYLRAAPEGADAPLAARMAKK